MASIDDMGSGSSDSGGGEWEARGDDGRTRDELDGNTEDELDRRVEHELDRACVFGAR